MATITFLPLDGSNMKTTSAMASAASLLGWGAIKFRKAYEQAHHLEEHQDVLRPALDFLSEAIYGDVEIQLKVRIVFISFLKFMPCMSHLKLYTTQSQLLMTLRK